VTPDTEDNALALWRKLAQQATGTAPATTSSVRELLRLILRALVP
jgi:hypothetical protein